jgi:hypothetical protein
VKRLWRWFIAFLTALDQLVYVWIAGWPYVWANRGECPDPNETISGCVGRNAIAGKQWALTAERLIDFLFGAGHCREAIEITCSDSDLGHSPDPDRDPSHTA